MNPLTAFAIGLVIGVVLDEIRHAIDEAPEGYEDSTGFHLGKRPAKSADVIELHQYAERGRASGERHGWGCW